MEKKIRYAWRNSRLFLMYALGFLFLAFVFRSGWQWGHNFSALLFMVSFFMVVEFLIWFTRALIRGNI